MKRKKIIGDKYIFYKKNLEIINFVIDGILSKREIEVLAKFLELQKKDKGLFNTESRKAVKKFFKFSFGAIGNHIDALVRKDFVYKKNKIYFLAPKYFISLIDQEFNIIISYQNANENKSFLEFNKEYRIKNPVNMVDSLKTVTLVKRFPDVETGKYER